jgi:hypothetical protein
MPSSEIPSRRHFGALHLVGKSCGEVRVQHIHRDANQDPRRAHAALPNREDPGKHRHAKPRPTGPLNITMKVNGDQVAEGQVPVSAPLLFTANDCLDIGTCLGSPVSLAYYDRTPFSFNGQIHQVNVRYTA